MKCLQDELKDVYASTEISFMSEQCFDPLTLCGSLNDVHSKKILKKVKREYTLIAEEFDVTRHTSWPEFEVFLKYLLSHVARLGPPGRRHTACSAGARPHISLLDVGCGNGRLYGFLSRAKIAYTGVDNNKTLLGLAKKKFPTAHVRFCDVLKLPFADRSFDTVWCIAMLHHIPTKTLQRKALREMKRVLKKNGLFMLTVWNLWQQKYRRYIDPKTHRAHISWGKEKKVRRFYHAFDDQEMKSLLLSSGLSIVQKVPSDHNLAYICHEKSKNS